MSRRNGRLRRRICMGLLLVLLVLVAAPYLANVAPLRDLVLRAALPKLNGTITTGGASLGWLWPLAYRDLEVRAPDGTRVIAVGSCRGDRALWRLVAHPSVLGDVRLQAARLEIVVSASGSNLGQLTAGLQKTRHKRREVQLGLEIVDGVLWFCGRRASRAWSVEPIHLCLGLEPGHATPSGLAELVIRPGSVCNHTAVTPQICDDLLKYVAPILADVAAVSGEFSIELDGWRLPLDDPARGTGSGRFVVHHIDVESGVLVRKLAELLKLPPAFRLVEESAVRFEMVDGRIHHRDLAFGLPNLRVHTHGSVGLDQSLDLVAEIPMPAKLLGTGPVAEALQDQTLSIPICGTLSRPEIDRAALRASGRDLLLAMLDELLQSGTLNGQELLERLKARGLLSPGSKIEEFLKDRPLLDKLFREGLRRDAAQGTPLLDRLLRPPPRREGPQNPPRDER